MSASRFESCLAFTWLPEFDGQGLHVTPGDRGGATAWGVTLESWTAYRAKHGQHPTTVTDLAAATKAELAECVREDYWDAVQGDELPLGVDLLVYDFGYCSGPGTSAKKLQQALGVTDDGELGPKTLSAAARADRLALIRKLAALHEAYYQSLADYRLFGRGWTNRNSARLAAALVATPVAAIPAPVSAPAGSAPAPAPANSNSLISEIELDWENA